LQRRGITDHRCSGPRDLRRRDQGWSDHDDGARARQDPSQRSGRAWPSSWNGILAPVFLSAPWF